jgi:hypothetical protein
MSATSGRDQIIDADGIEEQDELGRAVLIRAVVLRIVILAIYLRSPYRSKPGRNEQIIRLGLP